jgi:hypothetical protein
MAEVIPVAIQARQLLQQTAEIVRLGEDNNVLTQASFHPLLARPLTVTADDGALFTHRKQRRTQIIGVSRSTLGTSDPHKSFSITLHYKVKHEPP